MAYAIHLQYMAEQPGPQSIEVTQLEICAFRIQTGVSHSFQTISFVLYITPSGINKGLRV